MAGAAARTLSKAEIEGELRAFGAGDPRILAVYLFGSRGRGEETEQSDVDVGVLFRQEESLREVLLLEDALERRLGLDILRGERVFCADPDRCDEFELYLICRAGDLTPF